MTTHVRVAVIGGGVVGCSVLYHLARGGWTDTLLIERGELTCGSTWHAAGGIHTLNGDPNVAQLQQYTIELYKEIEEASGQSCGLHMTGGLMLAGTPERMDFLRVTHAKGRYLGMQTEIISAREAKDMMPLLDETCFSGALFDPAEGHVDPSGVTHAYAKAAKKLGASIQIHNRVTAISRGKDGWELQTEKGIIHAEHIVNAGGLWAREVGRMLGMELPLLAMEHMYLLTEDMPEVAEANKQTGSELIHCIDFEAEIYCRQESGGMLVGTYEKACKPWSEKTTPWDFSHELLPPDLDRITPSLEIGFRHMPALENAGIKQIINGPFVFSPDGNPVVGPVGNMPGLWLACGVMAGFSQGGGVGLALANWMIDGDPGFDIWGMDAARFGPWADISYTNAKVRENYARRFRIRFPNEELPAARPVRTTPIYDRLQKHNAVFGDSWGLESALWFAPAGQAPEENPTFRRSNAFPAVGEESRAVRNGVGMLEISNFAKYEISGPGAEDWLAGLLANKPPPAGRIVLSPMLNHRGKLIGDFTLSRLGDEEFLLLGSGVAEVFHMRWFSAHLPKNGVAIKPLGLELTGLSIAGPKSRELLSRITAEDVGGGFRFMDIKSMDLNGIPATVGRITFTGDLGYELWVKPAHQGELFDRLMQAGEDLGLRLFGGRALDSLRLEKSFGSWSREYRPIYGPFEAGMGRFVALDNRDFIGRDAASREHDAPKRRLVTFIVDAADADTIGDEPIWHDGKVIGWITSGGYAHASEKSVALGYVPTEIAEAEGFEIEILGERRPARIQKQPLFDPNGSRMRG